MEELDRKWVEDALIKKQLHVFMKDIVTTFQWPSGALPNPAQISDALEVAQLAQVCLVSLFGGGVTKW